MTYVKTVEWSFEVPSKDEFVDRSKRIYALSTNFSIMHAHHFSIWQLKCFFNFQASKSKFFAMIYLDSVSGQEDFDVKATCETITFDCEKTPKTDIYLSKNHWRERLSPARGFKCYQIGVGDGMLDVDELYELGNSYFKNGKIHFRADIYFSRPEISSIQNVEDEEISRPAKKRKLNPIDAAFVVVKQSSVLISSDKHEFFADRKILSEHSKVFKKMFDEKIVESEKAVIDINEFDGNVVKGLLTHMYYQIVEDMETIIIELFKAAKKYEIAELVEKCLQSIMQNIDKWDISELIELADEFEEDVFFQTCCQRIWDGDVSNLFQMDRWNELGVELQTRVFKQVTQITWAMKKKVKVSTYRDGKTDRVKAISNPTTPTTKINESSSDSIII